MRRERERKMDIFLRFHYFLSISLDCAFHFFLFHFFFFKEIWKMYGKRYENCNRGV